MRAIEVGLVAVLLSGCAWQSVTVVEKIPKDVLSPQTKDLGVRQGNAATDIVGLLKAPLDAVTAVAGVLGDVSGDVTRTVRDIEVKRTTYRVIAVGKAAERLPMPVTASMTGCPQVKSDQRVQGQ